MLNKIRSIKTGWILILIGIGAILSGLRMSSNGETTNTLLCFDQGCIHIQGITNLVLGIGMIILGFYMNYIKQR